MKSFLKTALLFALPLAVLILIVVLSPKLLRFDVIQAEIIHRISSELKSEVTIQDIRWQWFPLPHAAVVGATVENRQLRLEIPAARLYPDWLSLFRDKVELGRIVLEGPKATVHAFTGKVFQWSVFALPETDVLIRHGSLIVEANGQSRLIRTKRVHFREINGSVQLTPAEAFFNLNSTTDFSKAIEIDGFVGFEQWRYRFTVACEGLKLHEGVTSLADGTLIPETSEVNLDISLRGTALTEMAGDVIGEFPCFLVQPQDKKRLLTCGVADIGFAMKENRFDVAIREFELKDPGLTLSGTVSRQAFDDGRPPQWRLDLAAKDLDLDAIRSAVLSLWGGNVVAQEVCDIVRGGTASRAAYSFTGAAADFKDIRTMAIAAESTGAAIHVPGANLDLTEARGPIEIKNGRLTGKGLSAMLADSRGSDCSLLVGLTHDDPVFGLDLAIDADLVDLPGVLDRLVHHQGFRRELAHFHDAAGRASGRLSIDGTLHDMAVKVRVGTFDGATVQYDRLKGDVAIDKGLLEVFPDRVRWQGISGSIGPHRIADASGTVTLGQEPTITMEGLKATLDAATLYDNLEALPAVAPWLDSTISSAKGELVVSNAGLKGPIFRPAAWQYRLDFTAANCVWQSPLLEGEVTTAAAAGSMNDKEIVLKESTNTFHGQPLSLAGRFRHRHLGGWQGSATINATLAGKLADWLREQALLPPFLFPKTPATISDFTISWADSGLALNGILRPGADSEARPYVRFNLNSSNTNPLALSIDLFAAKEEGHLTIDFLDAMAETFAFRWQGSVGAATLDSLLEENDILRGSLRGDFSLAMLGEPDQTSFNGSLKADGLRWHWLEGERSLDVEALSLSGTGQQMQVEQLKLRFAGEETVAVDGEISAAPAGLDVDLGLNAPTLSKTTVDAFLHDLAGLKKSLTASSTTEGAWSITGMIDYDVNRFVQGGSASEGDTTLVWSPVRGRIELYPDWQMAIEVTSAKLCCLDADGVWYSDKELGDSRFRIATACSPAPQFQEVLPCLGIEQDVVEGPFTVNARLEGEPGNWQGGVAVIDSPQGRILRMKLLSRIFSIINLTDLFSPNELPDVDKKGFPYKKLHLEADIENNTIVLRKAVVRGEGLNLFGRGTMDLKTLDADFTVLVAPFKTLDTIVSKVPIIGRVIGGKNATVFTIPVGVRGPIRDPEVTLLPPDAIGESIVNLVKDTLMLPFTILEPILPQKKTDQE